MAKHGEDTGIEGEYSLDLGEPIPNLGEGRQLNYVQSWPWPGRALPLGCPCGLQYPVNPPPEWQARIRPSKPKIDWRVYL